MKPRGRKIIHNRIRCKICGEIIESKSRHDWVCCSCFNESGGIKGCFCDGGTSYMRWGGDPDTYEDLSESRLMTDEERDEYNEHQLRLAESYKDIFEFELME